MSRPMYRHTSKDAKFLGRYKEEDSISEMDYDLYFQNGQVVARFSNEPADYMAAGSSMAYGSDCLLEALKLASDKGYEVTTGQNATIAHFTTPELIAYAGDENKKVCAVLLYENKGLDYSIRANTDGSITLNEKKVHGKGIETQTNTKEMLARWPESLGEIWAVEVASGFFGDDEDETQEEE